MGKILRLIDEFYAKYNIYPNKIILGKYIFYEILTENFGSDYIIKDKYENVKIYDIDVEIDYTHGYKMSVILEMKEN